MGQGVCLAWPQDVLTLDLRVRVQLLLQGIEEDVEEEGEPFAAAELVSAVA